MTMVGLCRVLFKDIWYYRNTFVFILTPFILLPLPLVISTDEARCGYVVLVMAIYWITETIPLAATALLPAVLFPLFGVLKASAVATNYIKDSSMLFIGGLMLAVSIEHSRLHKRIALALLKVAGSQPVMLMIGFMFPTWFLSMWISNTATTAMMIPMVEAVLQQIKLGMIKSQQLGTTTAIDNGEINLGFVKENSKASSAELVPDTEEQDTEADDMAETETLQGEALGKFQNMARGLSLCVAYAANTGGTGSLTGTLPNIVLQGQIESLYKAQGLESPVTFTSWMAYGIPSSIICLILAWLWLSLLYFGPRSFCICCKKHRNIDTEENIKSVIQTEYKKLGPLRFAEGANIFFFILIVCLWLTRKSDFFTGWGQLSIFKQGYVTDSVAVMLVVIILFGFPSERPKFMCCRQQDEPAKRSPSLLEWDVVTQRLPWSVVLLLGGGFALADGCAKSGLSELIGNQMRTFGSFPDWTIVLLVVTIIAMCTEVTSNTAIITLFLPIIISLSLAIDLHPLYLTLPSTIAASYAFMLPVATPPNAIVFAYGHLKVIDMIKAGFLMNILCILIATMSVHTWGMAYFNLSELPWDYNTTVPVIS